MNTKNKTDNNSQNQQGASSPSNTRQKQNISNEERDARIQHEPDTRRLRSERQSVKDSKPEGNRE